jgi:hypothetical protein
VNRENNMVDPDRWEKWMTLLDYVKTAGVPMTLGDYALAVAFDNAPTVSNPDQRDSDHDGIGDAVDDVTLDAADVTVECGPSGGIAALNAGLFTPAGPLAGQTVDFSVDADGDGTPESAAGATGADGVATASVPFARPLGTVVPYTAQWDGGVVSAQDTANVTVVDTTAPVVGAVSASPNLLWPPNHKLVRVRVTASASDVCDPTPSCRITGITSNEPIEGTDDGDTAPDWMITADLAARLRAERAGTGTGRIYTITVACTDASGNVATGVTTVQVPLELPE